MCAWTAASRGRRVSVLDHAARTGGKLIISGGGRCNFTNREVSTRNYVSNNPDFARSALARYRPEDFIRLLDDHGIEYHERRHGQLFGSNSAQVIVDMLDGLARGAGAEIKLRQKILGVTRHDPGFVVHTDQGDLHTPAVVVATGGLSYPRLCASGIGLDIARSLGVPLVETAPALDGFVFAERDAARLGGFAGISLDAALTCAGTRFREGLLFTHSGLSGPVALQASLYWRPGDTVRINLLPEEPPEALLAWLCSVRGARAELKNQLARKLPARLAERLCELHLPPQLDAGNLDKATRQRFVDALTDWRLVPARTVGYARAEVTRGGVDTAALSSKTMEVRAIPGLYFIGEVVDVTGWLGGYNYQWAWASGHAAGLALSPRAP